MRKSPSAISSPRLPIKTPCTCEQGVLGGRVSAHMDCIEHKVDLRRRDAISDT
jgi:hypothetical protein